MNERIWRVLTQILYYNKDSIEVIKPFYENLNNENINDEKYVPFLKTFSKSQLAFLYQNEIITEVNYNLLVNPIQSIPKIADDNSNIRIIEEIISEDKILELQEFIQKEDIKTFNNITKSFNEVERIEIPLLQFCIMKNAIKCFKYFLVNGYDDPRIIMNDQNLKRVFDYKIETDIYISRYQWDSMATAIYFGNKEIMKILEEKGIQKGNHSEHLEAAILSYRNSIAKEILDILNEEDIIHNLLNIILISSAKNNNIKGAELLIKKGAIIDARDMNYLNFLLLFLIKMN